MPSYPHALKHAPQPAKYVASDEVVDDCARESSEFETSGFNTPRRSAGKLESRERLESGSEQGGFRDLV